MNWKSIRQWWDSFCNLFRSENKGHSYAAGFTWALWEYIGRRQSVEEIESWAKTSRQVGAHTEFDQGIEDAVNVLEMLEDDNEFGNLCKTVRRELANLSVAKKFMQDSDQETYQYTFMEFVIDGVLYETPVQDLEKDTRDLTGIQKYAALTAIDLCILFNRCVVQHERSV